MDYFKTAKRYFDLGYYDTEDVKLFVRAKKITAEQYKEITGIDYVPAA